jgi:CBS-domain-containing membrane protein
MAALREMSGMPSLGALALDHPQLVAALKAFDPIKVVTACGGLLTVPQRLPLLIAPATASALLVVAVALAIFKPGWRLRSSGAATTRASSPTQRRVGR